MSWKHHLLRSNGTGSGEQPQSRPRPIAATYSTPYDHSCPLSSAISAVSSLSSYSSSPYWNTERASQATPPSPISPFSPTLPLHPKPLRPQTPQTQTQPQPQAYSPGTPIPFSTPTPTSTPVSLDSAQLYSTLSTSTLHPPTSPTQTGLWLSYLAATHDRARLHLALTAFPDIVASVAAIRRARDNAILTPLPAYVPKYFPHEGGHLRNHLEEHAVQRLAKGGQGDSMIHTLTQRAKRIPKYRNILDEEMYTGALHSAQSEWIYSKNTFRRLYPPFTYNRTFTNESDIRRTRQGRWIAKLSNDDYEGKAARCPEFGTKRRITLEGKAYTIPYPKEKTVREVVKWRKLNKPNEVTKGVVKQKIQRAKGRRGSAESSCSIFSTEQNDDQVYVPKPTDDAIYETKQNNDLRSRAKSIFQKPSREDSAVLEVPGQSQKQGLRSRAKSIFGGQPATSAPASTLSNGLRSKSKTLIGKSNAKGADDEVPLPPSARPVAVAEHHAMSRASGVRTNPRRAEEAAEENDPCSLSYRSTRRYY